MSIEYIELADMINQYMPYHCAERVEQDLKDVAKPVKGSRVLILGASHKGGVGDIRESPALRIIEALAGRGGIVTTTTTSRHCRPKGSRAYRRMTPWPRPTASC